MSITYSENMAILADIVSVEEAESLLEWLKAHPQGTVDLTRCRHLHTANLQVLMAAAPTIAAWPEDKAFAAWLQNTLAKGECK